MKKLIVIPFAILLAVSCETTTEIIYPSTDLELTILDDRGVIIQGAEVKMFDQKEMYERAKNEGAVGLEISIDLTDAEGKVVYTDLNHELDYYFFINYRDRSKFLDFQNFNTQFQLSNLAIGSKTSATITLAKADNVVGWYTLDENNQQLPITIFLEGDSIGQVLETVQTEPDNPNSSGTLSFRVKSGVTTWRALSVNGCVWSGAFNIRGTDAFTIQKLDYCASGSISFWTGPENADKLPITVVIESVDNFGQIFQTLESAPLGCFAAGTLSGSRERGVYKYVATSADGSCAWTGEFDTSQSACVIVEFEPCN